MNEPYKSADRNKLE